MSSENFAYLIQNTSSSSIDTQPHTLTESANTNNRSTLTCFINGPVDQVPVNIKSFSTTLITEDMSPVILNLDSSAASEPRNQGTAIEVNSQNGFMKDDFNPENGNNERSYLRILEQPTNRIRYRYKSEKGSHGGLTGENSTQTKKTYPTVKLENHQQTNQVYIKASLYTNERHPKSHVHKLMGKNCDDDGVCTVPLADNGTACFQNLGILFVGKKEVPEIIYERKIEEAKILKAMVNSGSEQLDEEEKRKLKEEADKESKNINLNSVKICFEAYAYENDIHFPMCNPIFSRPIANQKSPDSGELKIARIDKYSGTVEGEEEVFLLCEKVNKKEIKVRFFETDAEGNQIWESFANFTEADVHHQVAIVFRTPPYKNLNIDHPVQVFLQLFRPRDSEFSEPRPFTYKPKEVDKEAVERKRKKLSQYNSGQISDQKNFSSQFPYKPDQHDFTKLQIYNTI